MKPRSKLTGRAALPVILISLMMVLLLAGCELSRPGGSGDVPGATTPAAQVSPPAVETQPATAAAPATSETQPATAAPPATTETQPATVAAPATTETQPATTAPPATAEGALPPVVAGSEGEPLEAGSPAAQAPAADDIVEGKALVKLTERASAMALRAVELGGDNSVQTTDIPSLDQRLIEIGGTLEPVVAIALPDSDLNSLAVQTTEVSQIYTVSFSPDQSVDEVVAKLAQDPAVQYAEPNYIAGITVAPRHLPLPPPSLKEQDGGLFNPNDPLFSYQWNMQTIQMPTAWDSATGQGVMVAIVDTGVDFRAPDLANTAHDPGYDFANNDNDPTDDQGHGTHVAGTIAQSTSNGVGVAGVAFNARILPVKVLGANGQGSYDNIIKGIVYAVDQGAKVINMSLAGRSGSQALREAVQYANSKGVVVVAAAGNSGGAVEYPAAYDEFVIAVGAVRYDLQRPAYSNFGPQVDLMAPGGDLSVDQNNDKYADGILQQTFKTPGTFTYLFFEGTSMASPHVAGLAALILSRSADLTPAMVENLMAQTAKSVGPNDQNGAGVIQAAAALAAMGGQPGATATFTPTPMTPTPPPTFTPISTQPPVATFTPTPTTVPPQTPTFTPMPILTPAPGSTLTPPPTPLPLPAGELLQNSGFESDQAWVFGDTPIRGGYDTTVKLGGSRSARLGNVSGRDIFSFSSAWQQVTIPAEATQATLRVNVYPASQDGPGSSDSQTIMILNSRFQVIKTLSRELSNSRTWENRSYNLADLKGQTIYIYFSVVNGGQTNKPTALYVDDVSLTWAR